MFCLSSSTAAPVTTGVGLVSTFSGGVPIRFSLSRRRGRGGRCFRPRRRSGRGRRDVGDRYGRAGQLEEDASRDLQVDGRCAADVLRTRHAQTIDPKRPVEVVETTDEVLDREVATPGPDGHANLGQRSALRRSLGQLRSDVGELDPGFLRGLVDQEHEVRDLVTGGNEVAEPIELSLQLGSPSLKVTETLELGLELNRPAVLGSDALVQRVELTLAAPDQQEVDRHAQQESSDDGEDQSRALVHSANLCWKRPLAASSLSSIVVPN